MNPEKIVYKYLTPSTDPWVRENAVIDTGKYVHEIITIINNQYNGNLHEAAEGLDISFEAIEEVLTYYGVHFLEVQKDKQRLRIRNAVMLRMISNEVDSWLRSTLEDGLSPVSRLYGSQLDLDKLEQYVNGLPIRKGKARSKELKSNKKSLLL